MAKLGPPGARNSAQAQGGICRPLCNRHLSGRLVTAAACRLGPLKLASVDLNLTQNFPFLHHQTKASFPLPITAVCEGL